MAEHAGATSFRGYMCIPRDVRFDQIIVGENDRVFLDDLEELGASLDTHGVQLVRMIGTPAARDSDQIVMYDGKRRYTAVKMGYAPKFAKRNRFRFDVLVDSDGNPAPEEIVLDYAAEVNQQRKNWSPIEKGRYYQRRIERVIKAEVAADEADESLTDAQRMTRVGKIRQRVIVDLAKANRVSQRTVRYRLELIALPECVQRAVASGILSEQAARDFTGLDGASAKKVLQAVAKKRKLPLSTLLAGEEEAKQLLGIDDEDKSRHRRRDRMRRRDVEAAKRDLGLEENGSTGKRKKGSGAKAKSDKPEAVPVAVCERRPDDDLKAEIMRLSPLVERGNNPRARLALHVLRWAMGETDEFPV